MRMGDGSGPKRTGGRCAALCGRVHEPWVLSDVWQPQLLGKALAETDGIPVSLLANSTTNGVATQGLGFISIIERVPEKKEVIRREAYLVGTLSDCKEADKKALLFFSFLVSNEARGTSIVKLLLFFDSS